LAISFVFKFDGWVPGYRETAAEQIDAWARLGSPLRGWGVELRAALDQALELLPPMAKRPFYPLMRREMILDNFRHI
jgi:hypothetical protein